MTVSITEYHDTNELEKKLEAAADYGGVICFADGSRARVMRVGCISPKKEEEDKKE